MLGRGDSTNFCGFFGLIGWIFKEGKAKQKKHVGFKDYNLCAVQCFELR